MSTHFRQAYLLNLCAYVYSFDPMKILSETQYAHVGSLAAALYLKIGHSNSIAHENEIYSTVQKS